MSLPNELLDYILSFLQSDTYSLWRCASSDPILCKIAERHIYAEFTLYDDPNPKVECCTTHKFTRILSNRPEVADYIRNLTIYLKDYGNSPLITIASLLPMLPGLTKITLNGKIDSSWDKLPEAFRQAFVPFLRAQVRDLCISSIISFPLASLNGCKKLRTVGLDLMCGETRDDKMSARIGRASPLLSPFIKHLSFRPCCGMAMEYVTGWLQARNLRSLKFTGVSGDVQHTLREFLPPLLAACSDSLTDLCLDFDDKGKSSSRGDLDHQPLQSDNGRFRFQFKLTDLVHLEYLAIDGAEDWEKDFPVQGLIELISTAAPALKQVHLHLKWDLYLRCPGIWPPFVPLAEKCSSLPLTVYVWMHCGGEPVVLSSYNPTSPTQCVGLKPYIEAGCFVVKCGYSERYYLMREKTTPCMTPSQHLEMLIKALEESRF